MTRKILLFVACVFFTMLINAQGKLSLYTRAFLRNCTETETRSESASTGKKTSTLFMKTTQRNGVPTIGAFIVMKEGADTGEIEKFGGTIYSKVGNIATAEIPVDKIETISELEDVVMVDVEKPVRLLNDAGREKTRVNEVHKGVALNQPYTGKGVVVGVCDAGIDFNHINFMDANGKSRVKRVYLPDDETGTPPSGASATGEKYGGSSYETPEAIAMLTTDTEDMSHGTHTSGTAAGSYRGNDYYGNAYDADLVLCGMSNLSDINIVNSILYTFSYAESVNQPAVVNLSLGNNYGPHDGTTAIEKYMDGLSGSGRIIVVSSGNEGDIPLYASKTFESSTDELKLLLIGKDANKRYSSDGGGLLDVWSRTDQKIGIKVIVYDMVKETVVYETPVFKSESNKENYVVYKSANIPELAKYYKGSIELYSGLNASNNKYNINAFFDLSIPGYGLPGEQNPDYYLGVVFTGESGQQMDVWAHSGELYFATLDIPGWANGSFDCSISGIATGDSTISVGAYNTKASFRTMNGERYNYGGPALTENEVTYFSSSGIDMRGISRPDVLAPGAIIISSVNEYDKATIVGGRKYLAAEVTANGRKYHWGDMIGTSMSAPAVTGILALWLEADPTLTVDRIKKILQKTSIKDSYVMAEDPVRYGAGKIDAYAGLLEVLNETTGLNTERNINKVLISDPVDGNFQVFAPGETGRVTVNIYSSTGVLLYTTTQSNEGTVDVKAGNLKATGVVVLQVLGKKTNYKTKMVLK